MQTHPLITSDPRIMTGLPCVIGTRITVSNVVRQVAAGRTIEEICQDYPDLKPEGIRAALEFAADLTGFQGHELAS